MRKLDSIMVIAASLALGVLGFLVYGLLGILLTWPVAIFFGYVTGTVEALHDNAMRGRQ